MLDLTSTGRLIKSARSDAGLTQEELAEKLNVHKQAVSNWERGKNLPDEDTREQLERILNIKLRKETRDVVVRPHYWKQIPELKPLAEIETIEELLFAVKALIDYVKIDVFESVVKRMLYYSLVNVLGWEIYYLGHCQKMFSEIPIDWAVTADDLKDLIYGNPTSSYIKRGYDPSWSLNSVSKNIERINFVMGYPLNELGAEDMNIYGFAQQLGEYGRKCGYDLCAIIPDIDNDVMTVYKSTIFDIVEELLLLSPNPDDVLRDFI